MDWDAQRERILGLYSNHTVKEIQAIMVRDGYVEIPNKPGWGVELNLEAIKKMPPQPWKRGTSYRADGSVAFI